MAAPASFPSSGAIVAIDDDRDIPRLLRDVLRHDGYEVHPASTAEEGLALIRQVGGRMLLIDLGLPGSMNGLTAVAVARSDPSLAGARIVVLTGDDSTAARSAALEAGADEYVLKPVGLGALRELMRRLLPPLDAS